MVAFTGDGLTPPLAIGGFAPGATGVLLAEPDRFDLILIPDVLFRSVLGGVDYTFSSLFSTFLTSSGFSPSFAGTLLILEGVCAAGSY